MAVAARYLVCLAPLALLGCTSSPTVTPDVRVPVSVGGQPAAPAAVHEIPAWEYRVLSMSRDLAGDTSGNLNRLGAEGWELCHADGDLVILKRPRGR